MQFLSGAVLPDNLGPSSNDGVIGSKTGKLREDRPPAGEEVEMSRSALAGIIGLLAITGLGSTPAAAGGYTCDCDYEPAGHYVVYAPRAYDYEPRVLAYYEDPRMVRRFHPRCNTPRPTIIRRRPGFMATVLTAMPTSPAGRHSCSIATSRGPTAGAGAGSRAEERAPAPTPPSPFPGPTDIPS